MRGGRTDSDGHPDEVVQASKAQDVVHDLAPHERRVDSASHEELPHAQETS